MTLFATVQLSWTLVWIMHPPMTPDGVIKTHSSIAPLMVTWMLFFSGAYLALFIVDANVRCAFRASLPWGPPPPPETRKAGLSKGATRSSC